MASTNQTIDRATVRMYCLGTGDCFVVKFKAGEEEKFTMLIDCGTCVGKPEDVKPALDDLAAYVNNKIDLLVVTHEHNDHVNGFAKCPDIFGQIQYKEAWFAWTETPDDPTGEAAELQKKRAKMKKALQLSMDKLNSVTGELRASGNRGYYKDAMVNNNVSFLDGMNTLALVNLPASENAGAPLPGMSTIKQILADKNVKTRYLGPGDTQTFSALPAIKFHVLGPPRTRESIFKDGKEGRDVFKRKLSLDECSLAMNAFLNDSHQTSDLPFHENYVYTAKQYKEDQEKCPNRAAVFASYTDDENGWRNIDHEWLTSAGTLALRLDSHINNTSLVLAIECGDNKKVLLFPGDAEYGSWESWHEIKKWENKGSDGKHLVEDLLNRTVFYKVSHHLSYNGTPIQKGIMMMKSEELTAMATLDRNRISSRWKSTMPNSELMRELSTRTNGRFFIMDEFEIENAPSGILDPASLGETVYACGPDETNRFYKQFTVNL